MVFTLDNAKIEEYKQILKERLTEKRYFHSLCVAEEAKRLAQKYSADEEKCFLAGLLHDITKDTSAEEHFKIFKLFDIMLTDIENGSFKLWHAISGSIYIKNILKIDDNDIFDAVRYHTTAKADMSLTGKILYLADFTSKDRDYEDVDVMRRLVNISLDGALEYALKYTINELVSSSKQVHPDTFEAYNQVVRR